MAGTVTVDALDSKGNLATGFNGKVQIANSNAPNTILATGTATKGVAKISLTLVQLGTLSLMASEPSNTGINGTSGVIDVVSSATQFALSGLPTKPVNVGDQITVMVTALHAAGKTDMLFPDTIDLASTNPGRFSPQTITLNNGMGSFKVTFATLGSQTITLTDAQRTNITTTTPR